MAIITWKPFHEIDRFFEDFPAISKTGWDLAVDLYEKDNNIIAQMNLPGIDPSTIDITVEDDYLRITGSREESKEEKKKHYYSKEIRRGSFERIIHLPHAVEKQKITADYKNGELTVLLPKIIKEKSGAVKVQVRT